MSKNEKDVKAIDSAKVEAVVAEFPGLTRLEQTAFTRLSGLGQLSVYVARTARVARVSLCGFSIDHPGALPISAEEARELKLGRVRGQLDFSRDEDEVLDALRLALRTVVDAEPRAAKLPREPRAARQPKLPRAAKEKPETTDEPENENGATVEGA